MYSLLFISIVEVDSELQMMIAYSSLFSSFIVERVGERIGLSSLFALLFIAFLSTAYDRLVLYFLLSLPVLNSILEVRM